MTTINEANAVYYRAGSGGGAASRVYAGAVKVWPPVLTYRDVVMGTAGLRAYWRLGEASGLPQDSKGTAHASAFGGTPGYGTAGAVTDGNTAITFNGSAWFIIPDSNALDFGDWPFTIEFWYKRTVINVTELVISKGNQFEIVQNSDNTVYMANQSTLAVQASAITDTNWHHWAWVRPSGTTAATRVYRDGVDVTISTPGTLFSSNAQPLTIGGRGVLLDLLGDLLGETVEPRTPGLLLHGVLDEISLYAVALTPAQVLAHFQAR